MGDIVEGRKPANSEKRFRHSAPIAECKKFLVAGPAVYHYLSGNSRFFLTAHQLQRLAESLPDLCVTHLSAHNSDCGQFAYVLSLQGCYIIVVPDRRQAFENTVELVAPNGRKSLTNVASKFVSCISPNSSTISHNRCL
jgi:hypothetical protein